MSAVMTLLSPGEAQRLTQRISEKRVAYVESDVRAWALARRVQPGALS